MGCGQTRNSASTSGNEWQIGLAFRVSESESASVSAADTLFPGLDPVAQLRAVMHRLRAPGGCPWDAEQTHESLLPHLLEEAYEVIEAARSGDMEHFCEELGDLLLQPVFHAEIASERADGFNLDDIARGITEKLIRRHPHVFGDAKAETSDAVLTQWEAIKRTEKGGEAGQQPKPYLSGISHGLPALIRAQKLQKKAAKVGFDWPDMKPVVAKIREELDEVEEALASGDSQAVVEEVGDLLFAVVNLARKVGVEAELSLVEANSKFEKRFGEVEKILHERGKELKDCTLEEMDAVWEEIKRRRKVS